MNMTEDQITAGILQNTLDIWGESGKDEIIITKAGLLNAIQFAFNHGAIAELRKHTNLHKKVNQL